MEEEADDVVPMALEVLVVLVVRGVAPPKIESCDEVLVSVVSGAAPRFYLQSECGTTVRAAQYCTNDIR